MDHSHHNMGHGDMDMGHGDHDMPAMCKMNMLFTWDTNNLCIVFSSWRITGTWSLIMSLVGVVLLTAGYEIVREISRRYEARLATKIAGLPRQNGDAAAPPTAPPSSFEPYRDQDSYERPGSLVDRVTGSATMVEEQNGRLIKAVLYGIQVFYSFFIMLLFMTYNGWIMLAVGVGAFLGYLLFGGGSVQKSAACH